MISGSQVSSQIQPMGCGCVIDDVERMSDSNLMVENIIQTLLNISYDKTMHMELLLNDVFEVIKKFLDLVQGTC